MKSEENPPKAMAKRLWHILYKGAVSDQKLTADLNLRLLIQRISKAAVFSSCRCADPAKSIYVPREVEFSCSNNPFHAPKQRTRYNNSYDSEKAVVAKALEILNSEKFEDGNSTSSPVSIWCCGKNPAADQVRQLRVTDSPFAVKEEEGDGGRHVDKEAEEFIRRFYQQLRLQQEPLPVRA